MAIKVTTTFTNLRPDFVSAWDTARNAIGHELFDALSRYQQTDAVRSYYTGASH